MSEFLRPNHRDEEINQQASEMSPTMSVPIRCSLEPLAPFRVGDAEAKKEHGTDDIDGVRVSRGQDDDGGQARPTTILRWFFLSYIIFLFLWLKSDQGGKGEEKFTAFSLFAFNADVSAVSEHDFPRDAQAQAGALVAAFGSTKEFVKNAPA